ncbi:hypothetical protein HYC85_031212 [Camellia sinensis]|uniref:Uncharacterized protein n=1 Tax=Camellia sinensis TaxID=4442 RepID=A0A7J7FQB1_CAMSI|nr:hypothetical protein HYC85_031212 [Camellia sinensis]
MCLCFRDAKPVLEDYTDSDMAGDLDGRKSASGFLFTFAGGAVSWQSKLQKCVALSTTEAEYIAAAETGKEMLWLKRFLQELGLKQEKFTVHCDNNFSGCLILTGNSYFVLALIDAGADINHRDSNGQSVMSLAVQSGNIDSVQVLIEYGFVIDHSIDRFLHDAAVIDRADLTELLFLGFADIDVNSIDSQGRTALHVAAIHGHVEVLRFLVSMGGDPDAVDYNRWTLLHYAASEGHHEAVEFLLNCSMFVKYSVNEDGKTAFALAVEKGHSDLYNMLHLGDALHRAARIDVHAMKSCIVEGVNVNGKDQNGWTALHRAAFKGRIESDKTLVSNGAQIDLLDGGGYTPLRRAVKGGHMQLQCI